MISYRDTNPEQAKKSSQSLLSIFVESSLGDKRQDTRIAVKFLDEQIKRYEESLQAAENRLKEFKLKYLGVRRPDGQDLLRRMAKLTDDIESARLELRGGRAVARRVQARARRRDAHASARDSAPTPPSPSPEIDARIAAQKTKLDELLRQYTDQHPDVVGTRRVIAELEEQRKEELEALQKAQPAASRPMANAPERNPVFQQLRVSLADAEANVASLRARVASLRDAVSRS